MAESKTKKKASTKTSTGNPVGRPRKKYGTEALMDNKKSFKLDENNTVFDKFSDALILAAVMLIVACLVLLIVTKR